MGSIILNVEAESTYCISRKYERGSSVGVRCVGAEGGFLVDGRIGEADTRSIFVDR